MNTENQFDLILPLGGKIPIERIHSGFLIAEYSGLSKMLEEIYQRAPKTPKEVEENGFIPIANTERENGRFSCVALGTEIMCCGTEGLVLKALAQQITAALIEQVWPNMRSVKKIQMATAIHIYSQGRGFDEHKDFGMITIVFKHGTGYSFRQENGIWKNVQLKNDQFIIHLGCIGEAITGEEAVLHQVLEGTGMTVVYPVDCLDENWPTLTPCKMTEVLTSQFKGPKDHFDCSFARNVDCRSGYPIKIKPNLCSE